MSNAPEQFDRVIAVDIDIQNDFCPGGALGVSGGDEVIEPMNAVNQWVRDRGGHVIFTADWHPTDSEHFDVNGGPWPVHCLQHKAGAAFHDELIIEESDIVAYKGMRKQDDGYSGWQAVMQGGPLYEMGDGRYERTVETVSDAVQAQAELFTHRGNLNERPKRVAMIIGGLATDYCVRATALDALNDIKNYTPLAPLVGVYVVRDAIRAVNLQEGDGDAAIAEMEAAGARFIDSRDLLAGKVLETEARHVRG